MKSSQPTATEKIQISRVLDVSIVDLCDAEANLVTKTPQALKVPIETIIMNDSSTKIGFYFICSNTKLVFSR